MDDSALYELMLDSMQAVNPLGLERLSTPDGVTAGCCPAIPHRSVFNSVIYRDTDVLVDSLPDLARAYDEAGVKAWTVWTPEADTRAREALEAAGHVLDATPEAMAAPLTEIDCEAGAEGLDWRHCQDVQEMGTILTTAFHFGDDPVADVLAAVYDAAVFYVAEAEGKPAACVGVVDIGIDAGVYWVGTLPVAQGRGLATGLMRQSLLEARERGMETTSLQATKMGRPVYKRVGFRELGAIEMWERRRD
jgi:GNAT superfamily N-acetyltransferase